ncbi:MAG: UDP-N-acetylmuramate:L-alanyl-gamma-D-glutamyl-meso-diaminopimelate ligase [Gammaproteobacteria bacterium]|jgi:UDP-N-acetylmuramate: L-alanyl-gamma-D-glutamyl-meso-diaminopimelate ligase|nr:UDP-N-acetylmuramate:L-alanyl-gamma-D-glutamyl-meso-diaminopimelate ligase [Gammaproteobacteria bacterium]MBT3488248.1 UDP-N-acetylmuramate:L-alanyl-gamma-D-glutamyl-meso-diaminopimelate ligase [Gammaproteobacteria bacterium]MBT3719923.1 UDP-N-acetylmuramate:L-alanyl-gamma-D-glutamyl-meso-diaminopimelate ligase [Gammaproteobacteria bacterium]MBT3843839.1 UDP-N-acetylmuramate:L-alanyl-gamma-D-glutamyl-meso-diaminopimelate ligase [Gammaproteobacteria bacterium]MBT3894233.1 UDP-N-acetylmuramate
MHIHILGICGTFMGGIALLARAAGHTVSGSDANVYPPMSTQLEEAGITLQQGYDPSHLDPAPDSVVIGNALSRGNPAVEYVLDQGLPYTSGPQWLAEHVLQEKWVLAISGTHGKTTTSSMLAWILEYAGMRPGFLIGGVPQNFGVSARLGETPFFVVEADEYDTAFFDKRSKFVHYRPRTLVINNLEFDHADIFDDLAAIQRQFHHLLRTVPGNGLVIHPLAEEAIDETLAQGCWSATSTIDGDWTARQTAAAWSQFQVMVDGAVVGEVSWELTGWHNRSNALAAIVAARHAGVPAHHAVDALCEFRNVRRRMEWRGEVNGITVYDDFAHHPTAIQLTLQGLRDKVESARILAIMEPRSNTMRMGIHQKTLAASFEAADQVLLLEGGLDWDLQAAMAAVPNPVKLLTSVEQIIEEARAWSRPGDYILIMSNGGFGDIHQKLLEVLAQ